MTSLDFYPLAGQYPGLLLSFPLDPDETSPPDGAVRQSKFRRHAAEGDTSAHILCLCEALASLRHAYLGSFLEPEDIRRVSL